MKNLQKFIAKATVVLTVLSMFANVTPAGAASLTTMSDVMDRLKVSVAANHEFKFVTPTGVAAGQTITITFPSDFNINAAMVFTDAELDQGSTTSCTTSVFTPKTLAAAPSGTTWGAVRTTGSVFTFTSGTDTLTAGNCVRIRLGTNVAGGVHQVTNATTAGSKVIALGGTMTDAGTFAVGIVTDDQVSVTASVDPSLTFNVGAQAAPSSGCTGAFAGNGGTVALGTLTTGAISSSDVTAVNHICTRASTNASTGMTVTVKSANASLKSTSVPTDTIPSATAAMAAGTSNYGLCASATVHGLDATTPTGAAPTAVSPFIASCVADTAAGSVGALTTSAQTVWSTTGPVQNGFYLLVVKAAISGTQPAHTDYADTLTFVATGTF